MGSSRSKSQVSIQRPKEPSCASGFACASATFKALAEPVAHMNTR